MIEAMACGTPVIALRNGSVPEVIDEGITGFIVDDEASGRERCRAASLAGPDPHPRRIRASVSPPAGWRRTIFGFISISRPAKHSKANPPRIVREEVQCCGPVNFSLRA